MDRTSARVGPAIAAACVGALLGLACGRWILVGSGLSLVPWALVGLAVGALAGSRARAAAGGAAYGFALAYVFMVAGYDGDAALHTRLLPFVVFGVFGAGCGIVLAVAAFTVRRRTSKV